MMNEIIDYKNVCRICLMKKKEMISIFDGIQIPDLISFSEMLQECASVNIAKNDLLSKKLCYTCSKQLERSYKFRLQCVIADKKLKDSIENEEIVIKVENECFILEADLENTSNLDIKTELNLDAENLKIDCLEYDPLDNDFDEIESSNIKFSENKDDEYKWGCEECSAKFKFKSDLKKHKVEHLKTIYKCTLCEKVYYSSWGLKLHKLKHGFYCKMCFRDFETEKDLTEHLEDHKDQTGFICKDCGKIFQRFKVLKNHWRVHTGEKNHLCTYCGRSFADISNLQKHVRIHTGDKPYSCDLCNATFVQWYSLRSHMITHTKEKSYKCELCNKAFARTPSLRRHMKTHTGEKNVSCDLCGKCFIDKNDLRGHKRYHSGEKKHTCDICFKSFYRPWHLKTHMRTHTGEKPFVCQICGRAFGQKHVLNTHINTHTRS